MSGAGLLPGCKWQSSHCVLTSGEGKFHSWRHHLHDIATPKGPTSKYHHIGGEGLTYTLWGYANILPIVVNGVYEWLHPPTQGGWVCKRCPGAQNRGSLSFTVSVSTCGFSCDSVLVKFSRYKKGGRYGLVTLIFQALLKMTEIPVQQSKLIIPWEFRIQWFNLCVWWKQCLQETSLRWITWNLLYHRTRW